METTQKKSEKWMTVIAMVYLAIMVAWMFYCGLATRQASTLHNVTNSKVTSTTMQWTGDTSWAGGWR